MSGPATLARRLVVGLAGPWPTAREWNWLRCRQPAGVILFSRNVESCEQLRALCRALKGLRRDLLICADHEGGPVSQLAAAVGRPPAAWGLGRLDDTELTFAVHQETGRRLRAAGVGMVLGPCADIMTARRNPVIGARAFGAEGDLVARHVVAAVRGLRAAGVQTCLKHWPGHGGAAVDSHLQTPVVEVGAAQQAVFQAGLEAGAEGLMLGHLSPAGTDWRPATLDAAGLARLRAEAPRPGGWLAVADDVSMGGLREPMRRLGVTVPRDEGTGMLPVEDLPASWFAALAAGGCDLWLLRGLPVGAFPVRETETETEPVPVPERTSGGGDGPGVAIYTPDESPYQEARHRLLVGTPPLMGQELADQGPIGHGLAVLDLAGQDRWQVAIGTGEREHHRLRRWVGHRCPGHSWCQDPARASAGTGPVDRLLVASHRPLPMGWMDGDWFRSLRARLTGAGLCRVLGHPSLATELQAALPTAWEVTACYDVTLADLDPS
ncbi:hypothetical protein CSA17_06065 [bacterium DOLJORAL78_65_58]|nr:MAG: hypothetical protein CSB20_13475 [bacterium DOLZORAL124_64_63]PIE75699.1 MAG: hypothetical protein CSA17_06065 [bacterium DOLJORAL78_65_58]